jgi:hypothetical protein
LTMLSMKICFATRTQSTASTSTNMLTASSMSNVSFCQIEIKDYHSMRCCQIMSFFFLMTRILLLLFLPQSCNLV